MTLTIQYISSTVEIAGLLVDRPAYEQGQAVGADVYLLNSAEDPVDVIVDVTVKSETLAETVDGLPLRTLKDVRGLASFLMEWDSTGFEPGDYSLEIAIRDTGGTLLDKETQMFVLGVSAGAITDLTATPESFDIGDSVAISMTFENVGTVNITGTAFIKVRDETGATIQEFEHSVPDLTPGNSITFDDVWDTSGAQEGFYSIVGYVLYDGKSTSTVTAVVSTARPEVDVYLPIILKNYP